MASIVMLVYFVGLTAALTYAAGGWGLGLAGVMLVAYLLVREFAQSHVLDDEPRHHQHHPRAT